LKTGRFLLFSLLSAQRVDLNELLEESDVISIHCNLTSKATWLIIRGLFAQDIMHGILTKLPWSFSEGQLLTYFSFLKGNPVEDCLN